MKTVSITCDGCGLPASAEHIAARMERLELATRYRPIHIQLLLIALEPMPRLEDDFYRPPESLDFFDPLLSALDILPAAGEQGRESNGHEARVSRLLEFQKRGYYLAYVSECPRGTPHSVTSSSDTNSVDEIISRLASTLVKRIRFNYKPKHIALLGRNLDPLREIFRQAGIISLLDFNQGAPLTALGAGSIWSPT